MGVLSTTKRYNNTIICVHQHMIHRIIIAELISDLNFFWVVFLKHAFPHIYLSC